MPPVRRTVSIPFVVLEETKYQLGINLFDSDELLPDLRQQLLAGKLNLLEVIPVDLDRYNTSIAVSFKCNLFTAALLLDIIRSENRRMNERITRAYINRGGRAWTRLTDNDILTVLVDGKPILNPGIFREEIEEELLPLVPPPQIEKLII